MYRDGHEVLLSRFCVHILETFGKFGHRTASINNMDLKLRLYTTVNTVIVATEERRDVMHKAIRNRNGGLCILILVG